MSFNTLENVHKTIAQTHRLRITSLHELDF